MVKLTGYKKIKTAVFISGNGSNLKSLIKFSKTRKSPIFINLMAYLDLVLDANELPLDSYNTNTHYCVIVKGHFMQYLDGMVLMGNLSLHGRIEVYNIEHC